MRNLVDSFGGWPVAGQNWSELNTLSIESLFGRMKRQLNDAVIFELWIGPDDKNSSVHVIQASSVPNLPT